MTVVEFLYALAVALPFLVAITLGVVWVHLSRVGGEYEARHRREVGQDAR
jgi:hypothetical protein